MGFGDHIKKLNLSGIGKAIGKPFSAAAAWTRNRFKKKDEENTDPNFMLPPEATSGMVSGQSELPSSPGFTQETPDSQIDTPIAPPPTNRITEFFGDIRTRINAFGATIKEKFPKNLDDLRKLQSEEALDRVRQLFSGGNAATYLRLGAAAFAAYFMADTVSLFTDSLIPDPPPVPAPRVARREEKRRSIDEYAAIIQRNIFNSQGIIPEPEGGDNGPARKTNLPFQLVGTVVLKDELKSIAAIEDKSQNLVFPVRVDDTLADKAKITKIERFKVYFINRSTGYLEYVEIIDDLPQVSMRAPAPSHSKGGDGVTKTGDTSFELDRKVVDNAVSNLTEVLQQARAIPNFENGMPDGYKIIQIVPGSIYEKLGIQNGDVVCGVNDEPINDPGKAFAFFNEVKSARNLKICVKRGGRKMTMNYDIH